MASIPRYKKVEAVFLGLFIPLVLTGYTAYLITHSEAVFWGRSSTAIYHGTEAYFISLLWFGVSALMLGQFLFRPYRMLPPLRHKAFMWVSAVLVVVGLASAVVLASKI
jgi:hypothetical protein